MPSLSLQNLRPSALSAKSPHRRVRRSESLCEAALHRIPRRGAPLAGDRGFLTDRVVPLPPLQPSKSLLQPPPRLLLQPLLVLRRRRRAHSNPTPGYSGLPCESATPSPRALQGRTAVPDGHSLQRDTPRAPRGTRLFRGSSGVRGGYRIGHNPALGTDTALPGTPFARETRAMPRVPAPRSDGRMLRVATHIPRGAYSARIDEACALFFFCCRQPSLLGHLLPLQLEPECPHVKP